MVGDRRTARWPRGLIEVAAEPCGAAPPWAEHVQGVTSGHGCWFVTQIDRIWRFPLDLDIANADRDIRCVDETGIPEPGVDHLGDAEVHGDRIYVAMEGPDPARVGVFDLDLAFIGSAAVTAQGDSCPWCAVNPHDGLLYSSCFDADRLFAYERIADGESYVLRRCGDIALADEDGTPLRLVRVQGGAFTDEGHLFLSSDHPSGGIHGIDVTTGRRLVHHPLPLSTDAEVVEGLTIADLRGRPEPWLEGLVHVLVLRRRDQGTDEASLVHFDVAGPT